MNNKILFADLDRTLLCDDKSISEKNRAAIQKMLERGHYFVLATGRPVESLVDIRDVKIDRSKPVEERMKSYVEQIKNPYLFKVGNTIVRVSYANTQATINDNFVNLLASM